MPDARKHRGPHPKDGDLFDESVWPRLQNATFDLSWLFSRGYALVSALKIVGDRYQLTERQRNSIARSSCSDEALQRRVQRQLALDQIKDCELLIDGFNLITTIEAALAGGMILWGRDGCFRDMASMHGSYRRVEETRPALLLIGELLANYEVARSVWYLDRPVSNSGRLSVMIRELAEQHNWQWEAELVDDPDSVLIEKKTACIVTADAGILDRCGPWFNLAREVVERHVPSANIVPMFESDIT